MTKRIDSAKIEETIGTLYPPPYHRPCLAREKRKLGDAAGLTQFGVNLTVLPPGTWSSQAHYHLLADEFVYVLRGTVTLAWGQQEELLQAGDSVGFKAGEEVGHCLQNHSAEPVLLLEIGSRDPEDFAHYPGLDLKANMSGKPSFYIHLDGRPYSGLRRRGPQDG